jgi:hypothetical protein
MQIISYNYTTWNKSFNNKSTHSNINRPWSSSTLDSDRRMTSTDTSKITW